jgi:hypothetical protein
MLLRLILATLLLPDILIIAQDEVLPFKVTDTSVKVLEPLSGKTTTPVFRIPWSFDVELLKSDFISATKTWDWQKNSTSGHSMPLTVMSIFQVEEVFDHTPYPKKGFLEECCPYFYSIYKYFNDISPIVSMKLLRRAPLTAYALHSDDNLDAAELIFKYYNYTGEHFEGTVCRFQIPIINDDLSGILVTLPHSSLLPIVASRGLNFLEMNPLFSTSHHYPRIVHDTPNWYGNNYTNELLELTRHVNNLVEIAAAYRLTTGYLHHFDTRIKHTVINLSKKARITLAFDILVNKGMKNLKLGEIFGNFGNFGKGKIHRVKESNRKKNVLLNAATHIYKRTGLLGTMVINNPTNRARITSTIIVIDLSVSFLNTYFYDTYKIYCGSTVNAKDEQLVDGECRVELFFENHLVVIRNRIETIELNLESEEMKMIGLWNKKQTNEYALQGRVVNQKGQVLMKSESVVIVL